MHFEYNDQKREQNYDKHGVDLLEAALIFEGQTLTGWMTDATMARSDISPSAWWTMCLTW